MGQRSPVGRSAEGAARRLKRIERDIEKTEGQTHYMRVNAVLTLLDSIMIRHLCRSTTQGVGSKGGGTVYRENAS